MDLTPTPKLLAFIFSMSAALCGCSGGNFDAPRSFVSSSGGNAHGGMPGSSSNAYWIPVSEKPEAGAAGNNGVYVIPSNAIGTPPVALTPATTNATLLTAQNQSAGGGAVYAPSLVMYYATGPDNNVHVYGLDLTDTTGLPTPRQIGSLSLTPASGSSICLTTSALQNTSDPSTLFVILPITGASGQCGAADMDFELVNYTDSPSTPPTPLPYASVDITALYQPDGQLGGLVTVSAGGQLVFYSAGRLAGEPTILVDPAPSFGMLAQTSDAQYFIVTNTNGDNPVIPQEFYVYRVTASGSASKVYTSADMIGGGVTDANNLYITDTVVAIFTTIYQVSLTSGTVTPLYKVAANGAVSLIGSTGSTLVFGYTGDYSSTISAIPVNVPSTSEKVLTNVPSSLFATAFMDSSNTYLYANFIGLGASSALTVALVVGTDQQLQASSNSMFIQTGTTAGSPVLLLTGVSTESMGGGEIYQFDPANGSQTPITRIDGSPYTLPGTDFDGTFTAISSFGIGTFNMQDSIPPTFGAVYDVATHTIVPLSLNGVNVSVW